MEKISIYQVDAFADKLFTGNPAAVCLFDKWPSDELMQSIAAENNLAETAFLVPKNEIFQIRWFTPAVEIDLCGHATLASAHVLFHCLDYAKPEIRFFSPRSGDLRVFRQSDHLFLDFPTDVLKPGDDHEHLTRCLGVKPMEVFKGRSDIIAIVESEDSLVAIEPNLKEVASLPARGLIVTARGNDVDFVSRFFAPQSGIDEDPVTGSAHTSLIPLWSEKLRKSEMRARQLSRRGGSLTCIHKGNRCWIGGRAQLYMTGELYVGTSQVETKRGS